MLLNVVRISNIPDFEEIPTITGILGKNIQKHK
jgi:hypothetical protein